MPKWVEKWEVGSHTHANKQYVVSLADDNTTWGCSCPAWCFQRHRIRDGICKHIREVKRTYETDGILRGQTFAGQGQLRGYDITHDDFFTEEEFDLG